MLAEIPHNRSCYHLSDESFISFCGRSNLLVRDYVEVKEGKVNIIGLGGQVLEIIPDYNICKSCLKNKPLSND